MTYSILLDDLSDCLLPAIPGQPLGSSTPRLFTKPLRPLTPGTSLGFEVIRFAKQVLKLKLIPWQAELLIRALELKPDGSFRFRTLVVLLPRQCGKSTLLSILAAYWIYTRDKNLVLGTAQSLDIAKESWQKVVDYSDSDLLKSSVRDIRKVNGENCITAKNKSRYRIAATNRSAGRGLSVDLLILDEIREQRDWSAWAALSKTTTAKPNSLTFAISNAGDDQSEVLNSLRASGLKGDDHTLGLFEWSAPEDSDLDDVDAWCQAIAALGYTVLVETIRSARSIDPPSVFRTESLCIKVDSLDAAVDVQAWRASARPGLSLEPYRDRICYAIDVAPDSQHVTLAGAVVVGSEIHVQIFGAWPGTSEARKDLPRLLGALKPRVVGWFPSGPGSVLGADLGATAQELTGVTVSIACQGFADAVASRILVHPDDQLLTTHVLGSQRLNQSDGWRFVRRGVGHVDAAYAAAGAVYLARTTPVDAPRVKPKVF